MKLNCISYNLINENVEKLIPFLAKEIRDKRLFIGTNKIPWFTTDEMATAWYRDTVLRILECDPKFYDDHISKKKTLDNSKAPFAKDIIRFMDAAQVHSLNEFFQFNSPTVIRGIFKAYNNSMRMGGKLDIKNINSFEELEEAVQDYHTDEMTKSEAEQCGFSAVYEDSKFAVFAIDKYIDSSEAPIQEVRELAAREPENAHVHACMTTTSWCVRHKNTFENTYKPQIYFLVYAKRGRRYSKSFLIHFNSDQFKDPGDGKALGGRIASDKPSTKVQIARKFADIMLDNRNTNDFAKTFFESLSKGNGDFNGVMNHQDLLEKTITASGIVPKGTLSYVKNISREFLTKIVAGTQVSLSDLALLITKFAELLSENELNDFRVRFGDQILANVDVYYTINNYYMVFNSLKEWSGYEKWIGEVEYIILTRSPAMIFKWIVDIRRSRWPEAEGALSQSTNVRDKKLWEKYKAMFGVVDGETDDSKDADPLKKAYAMAVAKMNLTGDVDDSDIEPLLQNLPLAVDFAIKYYGSWVELEQELRKPENSSLLRQYRVGLGHAQP